MTPRILLNREQIHPRKQWGQNFLSDPSVADRIIDRAEILSDDIILEIGAGLGALTIPAARMARKVYAVEKDTRLTELLKKYLNDYQILNIILIEQDILKTDLNTIAELAGQKLLVLGNLPYHISSQILAHLIGSRQSVNRAVLMFQKELAQRITAEPGTKDYGRISAMLRYCSDIRSLMEIKASQFYPKPNVDSQLLEIRFKTPEYPSSDERRLFAVIKAAFGQRRKTIKNALMGSELHLESATAVQALVRSGIHPTRRAETLKIEEFVRLSESVGEP